MVEEKQHKDNQEENKDEEEIEKEEQIEGEEEEEEKPNDDEDQEQEEDEDKDDEQENEPPPARTEEKESLPKAVPPPPNADALSHSFKLYSGSRLFQDAICVTIPLDTTVDLGVAMKRTRTKRVNTIIGKFPSLKKKKENESDMDEDDEAIDDSEKKKMKKKAGGEDNTSGDDNNKKKQKKQDDAPTKSKKRKYPSSIPQREEYASVLDYLEAKYVQGVMIQDDHNDGGGSGGEGPAGEGDGDDDEDDRGSVYSSDDDFLDDSLLKRDVTEQVLSQSIHTKLEAEGDDDFFVNVGNLEVEDHDNLMDYDPLKDESTTAKEMKKNAVKKKRKYTKVSSVWNTTKKSSAAADDATTSSKSSKKSNSDKKDDDNKLSALSATKKMKKTSSNSAEVSPKKKKVPGKVATKKKKKPTLSKEQQNHLKELKQKATERKAEWKKIYTKVVKRIKKMTSDELPVKRQTIKLAVIIPQGKKGGDTLQFSNPHVKGQKLRVKVPKDGTPGTKITVKVPAPPLADDAPTDNKFPRDIQELLDDYSQSYDGWCQAQADYCSAAPGETKFTAHKERMNKFDNLLKIFPKNLITPVDAVYLRKVVRRARQNKHKRLKTEAAIGGDNSEEEEEEEDLKNNPPTIDLLVPLKSSSFPEIKFKIQDFYSKD